VTRRSATYVRLLATYVRISGLPVVVGVSVAVAFYEWRSGPPTARLPGMRTDVAVEAILPCLVALGSTAGLVEGWSVVLRYSPRSRLLIPVARFVGTQVAACLPWLLTAGDPSSRRVLALTIAAVSVAACMVGLLESYGWIPLVLLAYTFLQVASRHRQWLIGAHLGVAAACVVVGFATYAAAAMAGTSVRRAKEPARV
jgi:hypothetical protein